MGYRMADLTLEEVEAKLGTVHPHLSGHADTLKQLAKVIQENASLKLDVAMFAREAEAWKIKAFEIAFKDT